MCGVSGYSSIINSEKRLALVNNLGLGIDARGGHAAGYISIASQQIRMGKRIGKWQNSKRHFAKTASSGQLCMMHARWATCGIKDAITHAHPYPIIRNGKTVLWGAHNGMVYDAEDSADFHGRDFTVDSKEIFELVADKEYDVLQSLNGYGVLTWIEAQDTSSVKLALLSSDAEICIVSLMEGGIVWASTWEILQKAVKDSGLSIRCSYDISEVGRIYTIKDGQIFYTEEKECKLSDWSNQHSYSTRYKNFDIESLFDSYDEEDELQKMMSEWNDENQRDHHDLNFKSRLTRGM